MKAKRLWLLPALVVLALIAGAFAFTWGTPYTGMVWDSSGRVLGVESGSLPEQAGLREGDVIVAVNGVPPSQWAAQVRRASRAGEALALTVQRAGETTSAAIFPAQVPAQYRVLTPAILVVALAFCLISLLVLLGRTDTLETRLFYLMAQLWAADLAVGILMTAGAPGGWEGIGILAALLTPVMIHFHAAFPERCRFIEKRWALAALYGIGAAIALHWIPGLLPYSSWDVAWPLTSLALGTAFVAAIGLIVAAYVKATSPAARRRIRVVVVGTVVGFGPFGVLTVLATRVSGTITIPLMIVVPAAYAVALWRYNLMGFDRALNRGLVYLLVSAILFGVYFAALTLFNALVPVTTTGRALLGAAAALIVALTFQPLRRGMERLVDRLFYGGWYDYRGLVEEVGRALAHTLDAETLADVLVRRVPQAMRLPGAALWLERDGRMEGIGTSGPPPQTVGGDVQLTPERALVPLVVEGRAVGLWALDGRLSEGWGPEDRRILTALGQQAALAAQNVRLIAALRAKVAEVEEMHRRLLAAREEERADLARELHDGVIQDMVGLRYRLEALQEGTGDSEQAGALHAQVGVLIDELRRLCSDLRPPALDSLGLAAALQALAREVTARGLPVEARLEDVSLPDQVAIGLYRIGQEALSNALRHAGASHATLTLTRVGDEVALTVADDGRGFDPTAARGQAGRWGLLGMAERAQALGGRLEIESAPGKGTRVTVRCETQKPGF